MTFVSLLAISYTAFFGNWTMAKNALFLFIVFDLLQSF